MPSFIRMSTRMYAKFIYHIVNISKAAGTAIIWLLQGWYRKVIWEPDSRVILNF